MWATVTSVSTGSEQIRAGRHRCTTPDGVGIEVYDFGGTGRRDLLMVHATGFCAEALRPMARWMPEEFHCWALDLRAHGRSGRPSDGNLEWSGFAADVATAIDHLGLVRPDGFGHSCGGAAVLLAEQSRPGTFRSLYCFEPVILTGTPSGAPVVDNPMSGAARRRRTTFPSAAVAFANFSSKPPFDRLDPEALASYVEGGFELVPPDEGGDGEAIRLRCRRDDEAGVYAWSLAHHAFDHLPEVACPVTLACGEHTDTFGPEVLELEADRLPVPRVEIVPGMGHFGPLERPAVVAESVTRSIRASGGTPRP